MSTTTRRTRQRDVIAATLQQADGPLSIEEILTRAQCEIPGIGIATVYRTIKLLLQQGQAVAVDLPGEETHYEPAGREHHHHFNCLNCGRWFELPTCLVPHLDGTTLREGYVVEGHYLTLYGRCPRCGREKRVDVTASTSGLPEEQRG